jgi:hypothetical protein
LEAALAVSCPTCSDSDGGEGGKSVMLSRINWLLITVSSPPDQSTNPLKKQHNSRLTLLVPLATALAAPLVFGKIKSSEEVACGAASHHRKNDLRALPIACNVTIG